MERVIGPVVISPDMFSQVMDCTTVLIDTISDPSEVEQEIIQSDVVLLMYDISDQPSAARLKSFWLPLISSISKRIPVIIVANKLDLLDNQILAEEIEFQRIFKVIKPLIKEYSVEMGLECSVLQGRGVTDVIHCAQRAFLFPLSPLYNLSEKALTGGFKRALTRIFRICDRDRDGVWSDKELMMFQQKVFKRELDQADIVGIKEMIEEELKNQSNRDSITLEGFVALQKRGIELMKIQICWTILRYFQYQDDLRLDESIFKNELYVDEDNMGNIEISSKGMDFLHGIFQRFCRGKSQLERSVVMQIFYPAIEYDMNQEWKCLAAMDESQGITMEHWLNLWLAYTKSDYKRSFKLLKYIGYDGNLSDMFFIKKSNKMNGNLGLQLGGLAVMSILGLTVAAGIIYRRHKKL